jgi:hypothetical protein
LAGIGQLRESDWGAAVHADGNIDPAAQVADLTGIIRHAPGADRLATWPTCLRLITRRTPRPANKPAKFGEHPDWEYGAFVSEVHMQHLRMDQLAADARTGKQHAVEDYVRHALETSKYPRGFPVKFGLRYLPSRKNLLIE